MCRTWLKWRWISIRLDLNLTQKKWNRGLWFRFWRDGPHSNGFAGVAGKIARGLPLKRIQILLKCNRLDVAVYILCLSLSFSSIGWQSFPPNLLYTGVFFVGDCRGGRALQRILDENLERLNYSFLFLFSVWLNQPFSESILVSCMVWGYFRQKSGKF